MTELLTPDSDERHRAFKQRLETDEQMVHRLRDWSEGDIIWGWTHLKGGSSMGKTYQREESVPTAADLSDYAPGHEQARTAYESAVGTAASGAVFLWVARIQSVRTEPRGPDPGEPPLKHATLTNPHVLESEVISDDA